MFPSGASVRELTDKARRAAELALLLLENRLELVSLEVREEMQSFVRVLVNALLAVQLTLLALVLASITAVWLSPADARGWVLLGITGVFILLAVLALVMLRKSATQLGKPLRRTIEEFRRDRESL